MKTIKVLFLLNMFVLQLCAMEEVPETPQISLVIDAPFVREFPITPLIGVYATPYNFAQYLVAINSRHLIAVMPESVLRALATVYDLKGSSAEVRNGLYKHIDSKALQAWLMIWQGLATTPAYYNAVFHQIVGEWLGKKTLEDFNVNIGAGLFEPQGIQGGDAVIPFNGLGELNINRHDNGVYLSPDNGRFYPIAGRNAVAFWLVGADKQRGRAVVSYNLILVSAETRKAFMDVVDVAHYAATPAEVLAALIQGLHALEKTVKKEDQEAIAGIIEALGLMQATQLPAEEKKAQTKPQEPAKKPAEEVKRAAAAPAAPSKPWKPVLEVKRQRASSQEARDAALAKRIADEEATAAYLAELAAREAQAAEENAASEAAIAALIAGEVPA